MVNSPRARDVWSYAAACALIVALDWPLVAGPVWLGMDTATAFYPWYGFLGEQLRAGHIPVWNPHQFSGTPFAADPESGWMYLPAMAAFTLWPVEAAARSYMLFHLEFAAVTTYGLARALGATRLGGLVAAMAYAQSGFVQGHTVCCFAYSAVATWLPLLLLGVERAVQTSDCPRRALWWGIAGLAFSQILAAWIGQGAYYAALVLGAFIAYRTLLDSGSLTARLRRLALHSTGIALFGFGLNAAGLLPRFEYNLLSNLPGGYPDTGAVLTAPTLTDWGIIEDWSRRFLHFGFSYPGVVVLCLGIASLPLAWRTQPVPFFVALTLVVLILARAQPTPLHALFDVLPGFERLHSRSPERALLVFYLGPAMLAAMAISVLQRRVPRSITLVVPLMALLAVTLDLHQAWTAQVAEATAGGGDYQFAATDLSAYYAPSPAARFLTAQMTNSDQPFRYFGFAEHIFGGPVAYTLHWADPHITSLEVNNRALVSGLQDVQGYNPLHVARYDDLFLALNGTPQNYHHADVLRSGLASPLLDLLNVRYAVMPTHAATDERAVTLEPAWRVAYADDAVTIYENPGAMPRAWLVHVAQEAAPATALASLASGSVDPRRIALLDAPPPELSAPADSSADHVELVTNRPDQIALRTHSSAPSVLVLSEVYYPAWHAAVDGQPAMTYLADGALRAVSVPAGDHLVTTGFESVGQTIGLIVSAVALSMLLTLAGLILLRATRSRRGGGSPVQDRRCPATVSGFMDRSRQPEHPPGARAARLRARGAGTSEISRGGKRS